MTDAEYDYIQHEIPLTEEEIKRDHYLTIKIRILIFFFIILFMLTGLVYIGYLMMGIITGTYLTMLGLVFGFLTIIFVLNNLLCDPLFIQDSDLPKLLELAKNDEDVRNYLHRVNKLDRKLSTVEFELLNELEGYRESLVEKQKLELIKSEISKI